MDIRLPNYSKTPEVVSRLTREQYPVTLQSETELPGTGEYLLAKIRERQVTSHGMIRTEVRSAFGD